LLHHIGKFGCDSCQIPCYSLIHIPVYLYIWFLFFLLVNLWAFPLLFVVFCLSHALTFSLSKIWASSFIYCEMRLLYIFF
jgi:hypothetical protein